jgi:hypothetical protein
MIDMPGFLCRLGLHKWRYEDVVITSRDAIEPLVVFYEKFGGGAESSSHVRKNPRTKADFTKRECQKCGIKQERRIFEDDEGNKTIISGWEKQPKHQQALNIVPLDGKVVG